MFTFLSIIIIALSIILILIIIVQDPKGGGTMGAFAGSATNIIGVQRTGDILEKGTWGGGILILLLCIFTVLFTPKVSSTEKTKTMTEEAAKTAPISTPTAPAPIAPIGGGQPTGK